MYIITLLIIDQVAKWLSKSYLQPSSIYGVINGILSFTYVENRGAAFGMMKGWKYALIGVTLVTIAYLLYLYIKRVRKGSSKLLKVSFNLIIAGALGNLIDRIFRGYVIDFIQCDFIDFPVFNVADICICIGVGLLFIYLIFIYKEPDKKEKKTK